MHNRGYIKALILLCAGLLIGLTAYAVISGDAPGTPEHQEDEQENENMISDDTTDRVRKVALYYGMDCDEAIEFLLKIGLAEQESFIEQAEAWDRRVQEMEQ